MRPTLGLRILELMDRGKMTQRDLAKAIGSTSGSVCRYISGERSPHGDTLLRIADVFGVSVDYLLGRDEPAEGYDYGRLREILQKHASKLSETERRDLARILLSTGRRPNMGQSAGGR